MRFFDISGFALRNFFRRKARSALTVLGVVIGTAAVVIMISIGVGMNEGFEKQISQWGNLREITVYKSWGGGMMVSSSGGVIYDVGAGAEQEGPIIGYMNKQGFEKIKAVPNVAACTPRYMSWFPLIKGKETNNMNCVGIIPEEMDKFGHNIGLGRLLSAEDTGTTNFVMTYNVPFHFQNPRKYEWIEVTEGMELPFDPTEISYKFTFDYSYGQGFQSTDRPRPKLYKAECVGIIAQKAGGDWDNSIYMDIDVLLKLEAEYRKAEEDWQRQQQQAGGDFYGYGASQQKQSQEDEATKDVYNEFMVLVDETKNVQAVEKAIRELGYETSSSMTYLTQMQEQTKFLRTILGAIGIISFVVAAISISNTMIMSIYERTREIGIMKVLGCKLSNVTSMFLLEAGIIGLCGGIIGAGASYGASYALNYFTKGNGGLLGFTSGIDADVSVIPWWLTIVALALAVVVGVIAGLYPAIRATHLPAIEAIKNE